MTMQPLSARLTNEQGIVVFQLLSIEEGPEADVHAVKVQEKDKQYIGYVKLVNGKKTFTEFETELQEYDDLLEKHLAYEALSDADKAKEGKVVAPIIVTVHINRVTHEEFPFMQ